MGAKISKDHEDSFPKLAVAGYEKTSDETTDYNCIAWAAADDKKRWWQPSSIEPGHWWPPGAPNDFDLDSYAKALEFVGFKRCVRAIYNKRYRTIVLYRNHKNEALHAAKMLANGKWSSKLGDWEDIRHNSIAALETDGKQAAYGTAAIFMRKKIK